MFRRFFRDGMSRAPAASLPEVENPLLRYLVDHPGGRVVDKWSHYFDIYHRHFARFRGLPVTIIEIGIFNGGSLRMWRDYFGPDSLVVGVDVNPDCAAFAEPGIEIVIGDQGDRGFLHELRDRFPSPSILIDDGGHRMEQQIATFEELYANLDANGVYLCEDTHTSYMPAFGGALDDPNTFMGVAKGLVDRLHAARIPGGVFDLDPFARQTDSLHFYDGVLVIERRHREPPVECSYGSRHEFRYIAPSLSGR